MSAGTGLLLMLAIGALIIGAFAPSTSDVYWALVAVCLVLLAHLSNARQQHQEMMDALRGKQAPKDDTEPEAQPATL